MKEARGGDFGACAILLQPEPDGAPAVPNYRDAGEDYYRPTRICPIMHVVGIRESLLRTPSVASGDTFLFLEAKRLCYRDMEKIGFVFTTLPWPVDERARALMMGEDFWSYGMQQNTREIEAITRYAHEQGLTARRLTADVVDADPNPQDVTECRVVAAPTPRLILTERDP